MPITAETLAGAIVSPDAILGLLFVAAFIKTSARAVAAQPRAVSA